MKTGEQPPATIGPSGFGAVAARAREAARSGRLIPPRLVPFLALIIVSAFFWVTAGDRFMSINNGSFLLQQSAIIAIPAFGVTMVIISGSIDLSVGSLVALTGMVAAVVTVDHGPVAGLLAVLKVPSFMVTLGMLSVGRGLTIIVSQSQPVDVARGFQAVGHPPGLFILFALCFAGAWVLLNYTSFGRRAVAIGGNERVARLSGVPVGREKILLFMFSGLMAGLGGIALTARTGAATPTAAMGFELTAIAAVVLGGTPLTGGVGSMLNTVIGAFILSILLNGMIILGIPSEIQLVVQGLVLIGAVLLSLERSKIGIIK